MKTRVIIPRPGRCGWARDSILHPLPSGLEDRTPVFIVAVNYPTVSVKDAAGREWHLTRSQVDCGVYYVTPAGGWIHESKPKALNALRNQLRHHLATPRPEGSAGELWDQKASHLLWVLQRNGEDIRHAVAARHPVEGR
ncbi:MAG TPA: hypothetical protein VG796_16315 [Verrucomicrobiales bacterium]|nr:hypothetical protein [Verrucomicrobiales bacterium]